MSQFLSHLGIECSENQFDDNEKFPRAENSLKNDIIRRVKMGPNSAKRHGLYPMVWLILDHILMSQFIRHLGREC